MKELEAIPDGIPERVEADEIWRMIETQRLREQIRQELRDPIDFGPPFKF
jgi:hypothetical protein